MKRTTAPTLALLLGLSTALVPSPAHADHCAVRWGSLAKNVTTGSTGEVADVRAGRHACFDRLVLDVDGDLDGYFVRYVEQLHRDGSGTPVPLRGGARLQVIATASAVPTDDWFLPSGELLDTTGYRTFRHVAWAGSFEGQSTFGLGVRARLPFRVLLLDGPGTGSRLVVDVAHRW